MSEKVSMHLTMNEETAKRLANVRESLLLPDNSTAARWAISLFSKLLDDQKAGKELRVHDKDGKEYRIEFPTG